MKLLIRSSLIFIGFVVLQCHADVQLTVKIPSLGGLLGSEMVSSSGRKFHAFRAIPYAQPPVGNLRFQVS